MAVLKVETGDNKGKRLKLPDRPIVVGRADTADIRIASSEISREHCRLTGDGEELLVEDLGSSNGTFVNGRPTTSEVRLKAGDRVTFGPVTLRLLGVRKPTADPASDDSKVIDPGLVAKARQISDDDVSSWLNETIDESSSAGDTKIIKASVAPKPPAKEERTFDTVAEEAADIFRRHEESLKS